jgi:hypothetical protein
MPNAGTDTNTTTPTPEPEPQNPLRKPRLCGYIKRGGERCRGRAVVGHHYCQSHRFNSHPSFTGVKGYDRVGFLEDTASIQYTASQILQGLLDRTVEPDRARAASALLNTTNTALRDLRVHERWLLQNNIPLPEQVAATVRRDGEELAPEKEYVGPSGAFEPQWSMAKYMYEQECEQAGRPKPTCAADFPPEGWLTEEEMTEQQTDPAALIHRYQAELAELEKNRQRIQDQETAAALAAGLPDPHAKPKSSNPDCPFGTDWCDGVAHSHSCCYCKGQLRMEPTDPRYPGDEEVAKVARRREQLKREKQQKESASSTPDRSSERCALNAERSPASPSEAPESFLVPPEPDVDENGQCWCGGPDQQFPCHLCRAKKEAAPSAGETNNPGLDLKACTELRVPHPGRACSSREKGGHRAKRDPVRHPCPMPPGRYRLQQVTQQPHQNKRPAAPPPPSGRRPAPTALRIPCPCPLSAGRPTRGHPQ